jgi:hypothetical protein
MTKQRCEEISSYTDNDNNTMMKQGCVRYDLHRQRNGNNAREEGRWRALKKACFSPLKRRFVALKKAEFGCV